MEVLQISISGLLLCYHSNTSRVQPKGTTAMFIRILPVQEGEMLWDEWALGFRLRVVLSYSSKGHKDMEQNVVVERETALYFCLRHILQLL